MMSHTDDEQQPLLRATVQPLPTVGDGCLTRFDPEALNEQQGADFSAAQQLRQSWLSQYTAEQASDQ